MTEETAKGLLEYLLPRVRKESAITRKVLAAIPAGQCQYKPSERSMSALELATHIAAAEVFFLEGVRNGAFQWKQPDLKTPEDVLAFYDRNVPPLLDQVAALSGEKLAQTITFAGWEEPAVTFLDFSQKHSVHHRGQLSVYLRPMGVKVPSIYGPSADEGVQTAAGD